MNVAKRCRLGDGLVATLTWRAFFVRGADWRGAGNGRFIMNPDKATTDTPEIELLARVASGDAEAFSQLYDRLANVLFSVAVQILNDAHAAEDAVQEVFVQIWAKAGTYDPRLGKPMTWAVTLLRNKAIDRLRAAQRGHRLVEAATAEQLADEKFHEAAIDSLLGKETARAVRGAVARLAPEQKQAIELAFFSGLTQTEIAATLQAPLGTVKARIRRGMLELREVLEAHTAQNN